MKFNKIFSFPALVVLSMTSSAFAEIGTINVSGNIKDATCVIPADQLTKTFNFNAIDIETVKGVAAGNSFASQDINFDLTACPSNITTVGMEFNFQADSTNAQHMSNSGDAQGVLFGITDSSDVLQGPGSVVYSTDLDAGQGTATILAKVKAYRVTATAPVAGSMSSTATIRLTEQ